MLTDILIQACGLFAAFYFTHLYDESGIINTHFLEDKFFQLSVLQELNYPNENVFPACFH